LRIIWRCTVQVVAFKSTVSSYIDAAQSCLTHALRVILGLPYRTNEDDGEDEDEDPTPVIAPSAEPDRVQPQIQTSHRQQSGPVLATTAGQEGLSETDGMGTCKMFCIYCLFPACPQIWSIGAGIRHNESYSFLPHCQCFFCWCPYSRILPTRYTETKRVQIQRQRPSVDQNDQ
jgi:hypothetical protein